MKFRKKIINIIFGLNYISAAALVANTLTDFKEITIKTIILDIILIIFLIHTYKLMTQKLNLSDRLYSVIVLFEYYIQNKQYDEIKKITQCIRKNKNYIEYRQHYASYDIELIESKLLYEFYNNIE